MMNIFMVTIDLPAPLKNKLNGLMDKQSRAIRKLMASGKISFYGMSENGGKIWAIVEAESTIEVMELIGDLPIYEYISYDIQSMDHVNVQNVLPQYSLN